MATVIECINVVLLRPNVIFFECHSIHTSCQQFPSIQKILQMKTVSSRIQCLSPQVSKISTKVSLFSRSYFQKEPSVVFSTTCVCFFQNTQFLCRHQLLQLFINLFLFLFLCVYLSSLVIFSTSAWKFLWLHSNAICTLGTLFDLLNFAMKTGWCPAAGKGVNRLVANMLMNVMLFCVSFLVVSFFINFGDDNSKQVET